MNKNRKKYKKVRDTCGRFRVVVKRSDWLFRDTVLIYKNVNYITTEDIDKEISGRLKGDNFRHITNQIVKIEREYLKGEGVYVEVGE